MGRERRGTGARFASVAPLLACLAIACAGPEGTDDPLPLGSLEDFTNDVQPHLNERCSSGGCHGRGDRPLALYAPGAYREDPARTFLDEPLTDGEVFENARRLAAFALEDRALDSLAVRKPLAPDEGGVWHDGGDVFGDANDPACLALTYWLDARPLDTASDTANDASGRGGRP